MILVVCPLNYPILQHANVPFMVFMTLFPCVKSHAAAVARQPSLPVDTVAPVLTTPTSEFKKILDMYHPALLALIEFSCLSHQHLLNTIAFRGVVGRYTHPTHKHPTMVTAPLVALDCSRDCCTRFDVYEC